jgi:hypothetical protein
VKQNGPPTVTISRIKLACIALAGSIAMVSSTPVVSAQQQVSREQDIGNLRLGQRVHVDDGTCPAGQVKEVSGAKMMASGVVGVRKCVPRLGPKTK